MIRIIEHQRGKCSGAQILIKEDKSFDIFEKTSFGYRGRMSDYFYTRKDEQGPIVTACLYGSGDDFTFDDSCGNYKEVNLPTVEISNDGRDWSESEFGVWLPDRKLWVGIRRRSTYGYPMDSISENLTLAAPIEIDINLAHAIYEALNGRMFQDDIAKLDPATIKPRC